MSINQVLCGNSIEIMENIVANSIDSIVVDGPYGLGFMGKAWDKFTSKEYQDFSFEWGSKALRVLKPGGHCLSFSAPRKYHRMVCGLEDAGFKIKDMINWVFGSGFPKSLDISKAIDKFYGTENERKFLYTEIHSDKTPRFKDVFKEGGKRTHDVSISTNSKAKEWDGWGTGLKPAQEPIALAQKPYKGTYAENVLKWGVGGLYIDGCRIQYQSKGEDSRVYNESTNVSRGTHKNGTVNIAPDGNEMRMFKPNKGRWPSNFILTHHPECKLVGRKEIGSGKLKKGSKRGGDTGFNYNPNSIYGKYKASTNPTSPDNYGVEMMENYDCHPECPVRMIDKQSIDLHSTGYRTKYISKIGLHDHNTYELSQNRFYNRFGDSGGASRFFYCAKAYKTERNAGLDDIIERSTSIGRQCKICGKFKLHGTKTDDRCKCDEPKWKEIPQKGNNIATLKPINLMRYLVRLITPPNGTVLDPFAGSGTTGIACIIEGFNCVLIEKRERFAKVIIPKRLEHWKNPDHWKILKDHPLLPKIQIKIKEKQNMSLEAWA